MENNGDQNAFPLDLGEGMAQLGLTIREYFAAKAMVGIIAQDVNNQYTTKSIVSSAVALADALIEELNK
ncbi:hypothetical protein [Spirosoma foliorum]|uniref:Uncharacterized protein n=1 Tax=Spirosoma foliorum TaxID=2710596 RepID=A0A7G5H5J6_9BACT|nr:hypothetical protein [Spirosoma foliorum]QMW06388.1 hypothetical protein H3H32_16595 [Spirosoma foliorum]